MIFRCLNACCTIACKGGDGGKQAPQSQGQAARGRNHAVLESEGPRERDGA